MHLSKNWNEREIDRFRRDEVESEPQRFRITGWLLGGIDVERMLKIKEEKENEKVKAIQVVSSRKE